MSTLPVCPACGKAAAVESAAFCPYCGASLAISAPIDAGLQAELADIDRVSDPVKKHKLLLDARQKHPDCLEVEERILYLGRLYERSPKKLDFSVIKCHLLHMYLTPKDFADTQRQAMRDELFHGEQLEKCLALAPDRDAFTRRYLERLGREFIQIFLRGNNRYMQSFFGVRLESRAPKLLAAPVADMIKRVRTDGALTDSERAALSGALYAAFEKEMGGETGWLNSALEAPCTGGEA